MSPPLLAIENRLTIFDSLHESFVFPHDMQQLLSSHACIQTMLSVGAIGVWIIALKLGWALSWPSLDAWTHVYDPFDQEVILFLDMLECQVTKELLFAVFARTQFVHHEIVGLNLGLDVAQAPPMRLPDILLPFALEQFARCYARLHFVLAGKGTFT